MKISAIVPAHITEQVQLGWLHECIHSLHQSVDEIIVMDDGSTIPMHKIVQQYDSVKLFRTEKPQGTSRARNLAVEQASNHIIFPLDCDDVVIPSAFEAFANAFDGTPLYPDLMKLKSDGTEKRHVMMDFECGLLNQHVIASVNVLHLKVAWESIGGWDEEIDYIEDGEYNARLLYIYCGKRFPEPVVKYRQHEFQKTRKHAHEHKQRLRKIIAKIRSYNVAKRGCCGGRPMKTTAVSKTKVTTTPKTAFASMATNVTPGIPGAVEGLVLVKYVGGKGKGKHYYKGPATKFNYKVMYNQYLNVDPADARSPMFELVIKEKPKPVKSKAKPVPVAKKVEKEPVVEVPVEREPVVENEEELEKEFEDDEDYIDLSEILDQNYRLVLATLEELSPNAEEAAIIMDAEKQGRKRKKVISYLERRM